ncbi:hypothetical protein B0H11DRAFT_1827955 [Mycena galericulata]|nr:hypothetical protein B0H11DRAFT_1827955 [Mycena galericulata]
MAPSRSSGVMPILVTLTVISTLFNIALLRRVVEASHELSGPWKHDLDYPYEPSEVPGYFRAAAMTFEAPDTQYPLDDDHIWASTVPPKRGFVRLGPGGTPHAISVYHQAHCVNGIRFAYVASRDGLFKTAEARAAAFGHVNHCFDVLRQSLMCKADTTLMPVGVSSNQTAPVTRRCRDWAQLRDFVDSNHAFWEDVPYTPPPSTDTNEAPHNYSE